MARRSSLRGSAPEPPGFIAFGIQEGQDGKERQDQRTLPLHHPSASALGSLPSVALSSGRAIDILPGKDKMR